MAAANNSAQVRAMLFDLRACRTLPQRGQCAGACRSSLLTSPQQWQPTASDPKPALAACLSEEEEQRSIACHTASGSSAESTAVIAIITPANANSAMPTWTCAISTSLV